MTEATLNTDIDSLLDSTLDDLADLPAFQPFPDGMHKVAVKFEAKKIGDKVGIEMAMTYIEPLELADPESVPPKAGDTANVVYFLDNEYGQGAFKEIMKPLATHFGTSTNRETMAAANGAEVAVVTKQRKDKKDETKVYVQVKKLEVI